MATSRVHVPPGGGALQLPTEWAGHPGVPAARCRDRRHAHPHRTGGKAFDEEEFLAPFRVARQGAVGETTTVSLVNEVDDASGYSDRETTESGSHRHRVTHLEGPFGGLDPHSERSLHTEAHHEVTRLLEYFRPADDPRCSARAHIIRHRGGVARDSYGLVRQRDVVDICGHKVDGSMFAPSMVQPSMVLPRRGHGGFRTGVRETGVAVTVPP